METLLLRTEWIIYCENCGHPAHCGDVYKREEIDGDGIPVMITSCKHCRCKACNED